MKKLTLSVAFLSTQIFINYAEANLDQGCFCDCSNRTFVSLGFGNSWSMKGDLDVRTPEWDPSPEGYDHRLGNSEFYTVALGYHFNPLISFAFEGAWRPSYKYEKFQTSSGAVTLGNKTRFFRLSNFSYLFDLYLNKSGECFSWQPDLFCMSFKFSPFIGGGVGVSYNNLFDFHSILATQNTRNENNVASIMQERRRVSVAAQAMAGITTWLNQCISFDLGYRFFYGGRVESNNYVVDVHSPIGPVPFQISPWKMKLRANEFFVAINYSI